jgi:hypothetical protein
MGSAELDLGKPDVFISLYLIYFFFFRDVCVFDMVAFTFLRVDGIMEMVSVCVYL